MKKALIFDSGTLITLSMNGLLYILEDLKKNFDGKFLITSQVKYEILDRPLGISRFELGALQIENLIQNKILELPSSIGISDEKIKEKTKELMTSINHLVRVEGQWIEIVSDAEMSCLALSSELTQKEIENIIAIDERTTRILCENPRTLEKIMSEKLRQRVEVVAENYPALSQFKFIRSSELVYVAYKNGLIRLKGPKVLEAALLATKFKGAAISFEEIEELKKL